MLSMNSDGTLNGFLCPPEIKLQKVEEAGEGGPLAPRTPVSFSPLGLF